MRSNILITGASSGLGRGMALEFAAKGRNLALCARRGELLEQLREEIAARHPAVRVAVRVLDVNDHEKVYEVFRACGAELGGLDRIIVNAGVGRGAPIGTGAFADLHQAAETNFVAAIRGLPRSQTVYAATKAGLATLTEGIRAELYATPIRVSTIFPGYIDTPINAHVKHRPFVVDAATGCRALVRAIEREPARACVPWWPWTPLAFLMRHVPLAWIARAA